jgi:hypothetical protein
MRNILILVILVFPFNYSLFGQKVELEKTVTRGMFKMTSGPNTDRYSHLYLSLGSYIKTKPEQAELKYPASIQFGIGVRTKYKIAEWYSLGYELEYRLANYRYATVHDNLAFHETDRILTHSIVLALFQRLNFDRRGNYIGKFLDMGVYGELPFSKSNILIDNADTLGSGKQKLVLSELKFMNSINYGASVRIGFNRIVFYALYRLSDIFKPSYNRSDLPRLNVGIQIGLHK